jgi:ABC-type nitrate/sulfonate/bicarbonate transport system substrate-binding protein
VQGIAGCKRAIAGIAFAATLVLFPYSSLAQQKPKLKPLNIALANHSVSMTAIYVAKHLGIFDKYGYDARVLVLEPRAALAALLTGDLHSTLPSAQRAGPRCAAYRSELA